MLVLHVIDNIYRYS